MARGFPAFGGPGVLLFDEDFDLPARSSEPEVIQPVFTVAELLAAREEATRDGRDSALAEAEASTRAAASSALAQIASQIAASRAEVASITEQSAEAVARLLIDCFAAAFPALSARHGATEVAAVLREILPALKREPKITVRISPHLVPEMTDQIRTLDSDLAARVRLIATDAVAPGDATVTWENGAASRDAASLWCQIENILAPAGLLNVKQTTKEHELVD
jgi:flagellar biosynthesis/type III secretory pathway protein FliH